MFERFNDKAIQPTFGSPTDETQKKSPKNRNLILKKKVNPINGRLVSVNNPLTNFYKASNSQESMINENCQAIGDCRLEILDLPHK